ncbi:MAG: 4-alpha-glucanotransferase [Oscillospiraceae bacterium]|jgi:4-alpha-glucanotransferase|nr:4-alpha-glucanotransferase [Oscillospiraceae bacterium]
MRKSGILMHISSLPSKFGIGKMGKSAYDFVDFLSNAGVKCWQVLPISPTSFGDSPYQSFSVYAGNPYFIDFELLKSDGILKKSDYENYKWQNNSFEVDYKRIYESTFKVLKTAYKNYRNELSALYFKFTEDNKLWLDDYALFMTLKFKNDGKAWYEWDKSLAMRDSKALAKAREDYKKDIDFFKFVQYKFYRQWHNLKQYANDKGIEIIGDMPIYTAYDSADVWCNPELFQLDEQKRPVDVAGCPPDAFSKTGQLWGNPLYNWEYHKKGTLGKQTNPLGETKNEPYKWWRQRIEFSVKIFDIVRIDHFRGFESYYAIPANAETAETGEWRKGPGAELFKTIEAKLGKLNLISEDLGFLTPEVEEMLKEVGYPGMKIMQFAFGGDSSNEYLPHNFTTNNTVVYTGTHDNPTLKGWVNSLSKKALKHCFDYLNIEKKKDIPDAIIRLAWATCGDLAIAQMQDFLKAEENARMNTPSTLGINWKYRIQSSDLTEDLAKQIKSLNKLFNRLEEKTKEESKIKKEKK